MNRRLHSHSLPFFCCAALAYTLSPLLSVFITILNLLLIFFNPPSHSNVTLLLCLPQGLARVPSYEILSHECPLWHGLFFISSFSRQLHNLKITSSTSVPQLIIVDDVDPNIRFTGPWYPGWCSQNFLSYQNTLDGVNSNASLSFCIQ